VNFCTAKVSLIRFSSPLKHVCQLSSNLELLTCVFPHVDSRLAIWGSQDYFHLQISAPTPLAHASVERQQPTLADLLHLNSAWCVLNTPAVNTWLANGGVLNTGGVIIFTFVVIECPSVCCDMGDCIK
jgi:hypothetical protein